MRSPLADCGGFVLPLVIAEFVAAARPYLVLFGRRILCTCAWNSGKDRKRRYASRPCASGYGRDISALSKSLVRRLPFTARCLRPPAEVASFLLPIRG